MRLKAFKTRLILSFSKNWMSNSNLTKTATEGKHEKGIMDFKKPISGCSSSKLLEKISTESWGVGIEETRFKFFWGNVPNEKWVWQASHGTRHGPWKLTVRWSTVKQNWWKNKKWKKKRIFLQALNTLKERGRHILCHVNKMCVIVMFLQEHRCSTGTSPSLSA